jgi:hypothetical protein
MPTRTSIYLRRLAFAIPFGAVAALSGSAFGDPATACAEPREWDVGAFDACTARVDDAVTRGVIRESDWLDAYRECCKKSGGIVTPGNVGECAAPPAEQAQEAERQPAPPPAPLAPGVAGPPASVATQAPPAPPEFANPGMTLWTPMPPPPGQATLAP